MLRLADDLRARAQRLEAELRRRHPDAVDVARRQSGRARQPDEQRIQVGALAVEVAGPDHRGDVADAAPQRLGVAEGVLDHPVVDGAGLGGVVALAAHDAFGGFLDQPVGRQELIGRPFDAQHLGAVLGIAYPVGHARVALPGYVASALPVGGLECRQRDPGLVGAGRRLDLHGQHEAPPALGHGREGGLGRRQARRKTDGAGGDAGFEHVSTIDHFLFSPWRGVPGRVRVPVVGKEANHPGSNPRRTRQRSVPEAARIAGWWCRRQLAVLGRPP